MKLISGGPTPSSFIEFGNIVTLSLIAKVLLKVTGMGGQTDLFISVFLIQLVLIGNSVPALEMIPITAPPTLPDPIVLRQLETKHNFMAHILGISEYS